MVLEMRMIYISFIEKKSYGIVLDLAIITELTVKVKLSNTSAQ
jgi:hypothetical protein